MSAACSNTEIRSVVVIGYGVMGVGIVRSFAAASFRVAVVSRRAGRLADLPTGVAASIAMPTEVPDLVVETIAEDVEAKRAVYRAAEATYPPPVTAEEYQAAIDYLVRVKVLVDADGMVGLDPVVARLIAAG